MGRWGPAELSERRASRPGPRSLKDGDPDLPTDSDTPPSLGKHVLENTVRAKRLLCVLPLTLLSVGFLPSYCLIAAPGVFSTKCVSFCGGRERGQGTHASQVHRALSLGHPRISFRGFESLHFPPWRKELSGGQSISCSFAVTL